MWYRRVCSMYGKRLEAEKNKEKNEEEEEMCERMSF
jgi:hypothetical protein